MKTLRNLLFSVLAAGLLGSCGTMLSGMVTRASHVEQGMSMDDVRSQMGKPDYRRFTDDKEQWEYRSFVGLSGDYDVVVIDFRQGRVVAMDSFREFHPRMPEPPQATEKKSE